MLVEIGRGLCAQTGAPSVDGILGQHGIDWADIHLAGMTRTARLHKVLNQGLGTEYDVFETFDLTEVIDEGIH